MFEQNYGAKDTRWLLWFIAVIIIYALLTAFPQTERLAGWIGTVLTGVGVYLFHVAIGRWIRDNLFSSRRK